MAVLARDPRGGSTRFSRVCGYVAAALVGGDRGPHPHRGSSAAPFSTSASRSRGSTAPYFLAVSIFLAAAFTLRTGGHVRVMLLSQNVPPRVAHRLDFAADPGRGRHRRVARVVAHRVRLEVVGDGQHLGHHRRDPPSSIPQGGDGLRGGAPHPPARGAGDPPPRGRPRPRTRRRGGSSGWDEAVTVLAAGVVIGVLALGLGLGVWVGLALFAPGLVGLGIFRAACRSRSSSPSSPGT